MHSNLPGPIQTVGRAEVMESIRKSKELLTLHDEYFSKSGIPSPKALLEPPVRLTPAVGPVELQLNILAKEKLVDPAHNQAGLG